MAEPTTAEIRAEARRIHHCPEGYDGPCWGPTLRDLEVARDRLRDAANSVASGGPDVRPGPVESNRTSEADRG